MAKRVWSRLSPLVVAAPVGVSALLGAFAYAIATRAGYPVGVAAALAGVIGLLWLCFLIGRLLSTSDSGDEIRRD